MAALQQLVERLDPSHALEELARELTDTLRFDYAGIAVRHREAASFHVLGSVDRRHEGRSTRNVAFPVEGTVGEWVQSTQLPFVGGEPRELVRFQQTMTDMLRHGFASNAVLPLDLGSEHFGVFYVLAVRPRSFTVDDLAVLSRVARILAPVTRAHIAARELADGVAGYAENGVGESDRSALTMVEFERAYIERILTETGGVIEGPRGAAKILGLKPSTLRSRMRRLGVRRAQAVH